MCLCFPVPLSTCLSYLPGALAFHALKAPTFEEVQHVAEWTHAGIERVLRAHGRTLDGMGDEPAELTHDMRVMPRSP